MTIRILLADDHKMFRETLRIPLELEQDLKVAAEATTGNEVLLRLQATPVDILVLDIGLPDMNGITVAQLVASRHPDTKIVALSGYTDRIFLEEMMKAGAKGFVAKSAGADELIDAIRAVCQGKVYVSPEVSAAVVTGLAPAPGDAPPITALGKKEREVLALLARGMSSPQIADLLGISTGTVHVHRRNIKLKLNLRSVAELTRYAIREGLIAVQ